MSHATLFNAVRACDLLPGDRDRRGPGDGLRLAIQRRIRSSEHLPEDVPVRPGGRAHLRHPDERQPVDQPVSACRCCGCDFDAGQGLAQAKSIYDAARLVGECVRRVAEIDRAALERDSFNFNVNLLLGGQIRGEAPGLYLIYPQGNPLQATEDSPYLQLGECKYGRPILDRGIDMRTTLEVAAKYALLSFDATMRSNVTVGPPIDLLLYKRNTFEITRHRRLAALRPGSELIHASWEQSLRKAVEQLPEIHFDEPDRAQHAAGAVAEATGRRDADVIGQG